MKSWLMAVCLFLFVGVSAHADELDADGKRAYATLKSVSLFATYGVGRAGVKSDGEKALRILLKQKQAEAALQSLLQEANLTGQMYALVGLKSVNPTIFEKAVTPFLTLKTRVKTAHGCLVSSEIVEKIVEDIRKGNYPLRPERKQK